MRSLMQVVVAVLAVLCSWVAKADGITANGGGLFVLPCSGSGEPWNPSCDGFTVGSLYGPNGVGVFGANGAFFLGNLDASIGDVFISLTGHPISTEIDQYGDIIYTFAGGSLSYQQDGAGCSGGPQPPGYACVPSLFGGGLIEPGVDPDFNATILPGVTVEDESALRSCPRGCYVITGLVEVTAAGIVQYGGFGTDTFVGRFSDDLGDFSLSATPVPEVSSVVLLGPCLFVIALFRRRARKPRQLFTEQGRALGWTHRGNGVGKEPGAGV